MPQWKFYKGTKDRDGRQKKRHTLTAEFTLFFFLLILGTLVCCVLFNTFFLEKYYIKQKRKALWEAFGSLNDASTTDSFDSDEFGITLSRISGKDNIEIIVMDADSHTVKSVATDVQAMTNRLLENLLGLTDPASDDSTQAASESRLPDGAGNYYLVQVLDRSSDQTIQIVTSRTTGAEYLEMWGILSDGNFYLMRSALESIHNNSGIANRFFLIIGILSLCIGTVACIFFSRRITRPIQKLTEISQQMRQLDFSAKYNGNDATEISVLGDNINELSSALEKTISELKTANNQLQQDIERREKTEQMQREFISNVTHELKTPLALIQGYAEGLQEGIADDDPDTRNEYCAVIVDEAQKMNGMVQKMLELTHLEFGEETVSFEHFDIVDLIRTYLNSAEILADSKNVSLQFEDRDPIMVWSDPFMVQEVFQNYYSNALNHAEGDKTISIRFTPKETCVRVSVYNSGQPIPEDSLPHIWERFYKVDKARTRAYGGSGVGLSIVKAIMELLGQQYGAINYSDGVEFWFELDTRTIDIPSEHQPAVLTEGSGDDGKSQNT